MFPYISVLAQRNTFINGYVHDVNGQAIPNVAVLVKLDRITGAASNDNGYYHFSFITNDSVQVSYSHPAYETQTLKVAPKDTITANVVLHDKTNTLAEVVVKGQVVRASGNSFVYLPTQRQKNSSNSGVSLLYNIMLPELNVNPFTNSINSTDGSNVSYYIDGRKSTINDINRLRPKDIVRIEVYNNAIDKFPNEQKVINFILRSYDYGGYVDVKTDNRFFYNYHNQSVQLNVDSKKWNFAVLGDASNINDNGIKSTGTENLLLNTPIERVTDVYKGENQTDNYSGLFQALCKSKSFQLYLQTGLNISKNTSNESSRIGYISDKSYYSDTYQKTYSKGITPKLNLFLKKEISKCHVIETRITSSFLNKKYNRDYDEGIYSLNNNVKENACKIDGNIKWNYIINKNNSLSVFLWDVYSYNKNKYKGDRGDNQLLEMNDFLLYPTYTYNKREKFYFSCQAGFNISHNKINDYKYTKIYPRPALTLNYYISKINSLFMDVRLGSTIPLLSRMNTAEQQINNLQIVRGNPNLKSMKILDGLLAYNIHTDMFQMSAFFSYNALYDLSKLNYITEDNKLIQTYVSDGNFNDYKFGVNSTWSCFNRNLQIRCSLAYQKQEITGKDNSAINNFIYNINLLYHLKSFAFSAYFTPKSINISTSPMIFKSPVDYGLLASWGGKGLFVELGIRRIFEKELETYRHYNYDKYNIKSYGFSDSQNRQIYVKLSYNFDFGRKIKHEKVENKNSINSSIIL